MPYMRVVPSFSNHMLVHASFRIVCEVELKWCMLNTMPGFAGKTLYRPASSIGLPSDFGVFSSGRCAPGKLVPPNRPSGDPGPHTSCCKVPSTADTIMWCEPGRMRAWLR